MIDLDAILGQLFARDGARALDLGCGSGRLIASLAARGVACVAVDRVRPADLDAAVDLRLQDLRDFDPGESTFDVVFARHVLQFFDRNDRRTIVRRALGALREGGVLLVEAFTTDDPSRVAAEQRHFIETEPRTFVAPGGHERMSFFAPGELPLYLNGEGGRVLHHEERIIDDDHAPLGPHRHAVAFAAVMRER